MEYLEIKDNIVMKHCCGDFPRIKKEGISYKVIRACGVNEGDDIRFFKNLETGEMWPLKTLLKKGLVQIPIGKKLNEDETAFIDMSLLEQLQAGIIFLEPHQKIENNQIVEKTPKEKYDSKLISKDDYNAYIDTLRQEAYKEEADPMGFQVLRGELDKKIWLKKIDEIKKKFPKI